MRIATGSRREILREIGGSLGSGPEAPALRSIVCFISAEVETDFRLWLYWDERLPVRGSLAARRIEAGLGSVGLVKHSVWYEVERS